MVGTHARHVATRNESAEQVVTGLVLTPSLCHLLDDTPIVHCPNPQMQRLQWEKRPYPADVRRVGTLLKRGRHRHSLACVYSCIVSRAMDAGG